MEPLRLRPMTASEFAPFRSRQISGYAAAKVQASEWAEDEAEALATAQTDDLLPEGPNTPEMLLLTADNSDGQQVGHVWVALNRPRSEEAWIFDIEINPEHRGKGYGRALLQAAEQEATKHKATSISLNVFGSNSVARHLYESSAYQITAMQMRKELATMAVKENQAN